MKHIHQHTHGSGPERTQHTHPHAPGHHHANGHRAHLNGHADDKGAMLKTAGAVLGVVAGAKLIDAARHAVSDAAEATGDAARDVARAGREQAKESKALAREGKELAREGKALALLAGKAGKEAGKSARDEGKEAGKLAKNLLSEAGERTGFVAELAGDWGKAGAKGVTAAPKFLADVADLGGETLGRAGKASRKRLEDLGLVKKRPSGLAALLAFAGLSKAAGKAVDALPTPSIHLPDININRISPPPLSVPDFGRFDLPYPWRSEPWYSPSRLSALPAPVIERIAPRKKGPDFSVPSLLLGIAVGAVAVFLLNGASRRWLMRQVRGGEPELHRTTQGTWNADTAERPRATVHVETARTTAHAGFEKKYDLPSRHEFVYTNDSARSDRTNGSDRPATVDHRTMRADGSIADAPRIAFEDRKDEYPATVTEDTVVLDEPATAHDRSISDAELVDAIEAALVADPVTQATAPTNIRVTASGGRVTISGMVPNQVVYQEAAEIVRRVPGVTEVVNNLQIGQHA